MWENILLDDKERKLLEILMDKNTIKEAEKELKKEGINLSSAYKMVESVQKRGSKAMQLVNQILGFRRRSKSHSGLLIKRLQFSE